MRLSCELVNRDNSLTLTNGWPIGIPRVRPIVGIRWDENAGLRRDAIRSQVIDALEAQEIKETGNEKD